MFNVDNNKAKEIVDAVFKDVFGVNNSFTLEKVKEKFAFDIPLPQRIGCILSGKDTWVVSKENNKIASQKALEEEFKKSEWMRKKEEISSIGDLLRCWNKINYVTGDKNLNSQDVFGSDGVYTSASVFNSHAVFKSKNIIYSYKIFDCNYMIACRDNESSTFGIRMRESVNCSSGFEISWCEKVSRSMYVHDGVDIYECMFCSHIRSKKYCIANMQFSKDEYFKIKKQVIEWILDSS